MELELGLKITKTRDDIDSISEYQLMKDTGPVFKSKETNTMFILTAHLKGYKRNNIDINISKDGNKISIRGKKPIQEMVMMGWVMQRKVVDVKGFNKVFKIPYGVNLDKIKANYNEEEWMLNIVMPKLVKGVFGLKIEEIKEQEFDKGRIEQGKSDFDDVSSSVGETSKKESKEVEFQHMEGSENIIEKMIDDTKKEINEERIVKEVGEYKLRIEDGNGKSVREKGGKEEFKDQSGGVTMSKEIEDASQDKEFEDGKLNSGSVDKRLDDVNRDLIGSTIKKDNEESKLKIKDNKVKDASQIGFKESIIQQSEELKQSEFREPNCESKVRLDENVVDHIPNNIGCRNQTQLKGEYEKPPFEAYEDVQKTIQKEIIKPDKEGFDAKITINEDFPKNLPKNSNEGSEGLNNQKMQESKNEKEEMVSKDVEYFLEKGEGERLKMVHEEAKKGNNTNETMEKEIEEIDNGIVESGQQPVVEMKGSKCFDVAKEGEQKEVKKEALVENESLIVEGDESKEITKEIVQDEEDKIENGIVKLKGEGFRKMYVEPNESFEGPNVNNGIFDRRETKMFDEIEQTKDVDEKGVNNENSMKIQNEENEGFRKNKRKAKDEWFLQEEMSKGRSKGNKATKEDLPMNFSDSPIDTREGQKNTMIEKVKGIKESVKESNMKPFEANEDVHKNFEKPKMESKDGDQESIREKPNKEGFYAEINEEAQNYLPKSNHEQNEGLNVQKRREIKDDKENVVKRKGREIEYFVEKEGSDRLKNMHVKEMKGNNTIETMQDEIEKSEYGIKESDQQHENENSGKGTYEVSKRETGELPRQVTKIDGSKEFDVAKEEEKDEVLNEALVESQSLVEMVQGEESNQITKEKVQDDEENANIGTFDGRKTSKFQEMKQTEDVKEKNAKVEKFAKTMNEKIQNEEDEDLKKNTTKEKDECCLQEKLSEERCQETKYEKEDFSMKMLDSQIDAREAPKDRKMDKTKDIKEESAKVKREKYEKIVEENDGLWKNITKRKQTENEEAKIVTKIKDQESLQKEKSKGRNEASTIYSPAKAKEPEENNSKAKEIGTLEREFQSVASMGFKEFDYGNAKDKKQNMTMLPSKFQSKDTHESKDESINQNILHQKKTKEVGTIDDEEKDKSCEGSKAKYKGCLESKRKNHTKDIQNFIEMKENEEAKQNDTLKQEMSLEKELEKGEKDEFLNEEIVQEKEGEPLESSLKIDIAEVKTKRPLEIEKTIVQWKCPTTKDQHDYGNEEIKLPKIAACQEAKPSKLQRPMNNQQSTEKIKAIGEHEATKDSPMLNIVEAAKSDSLQPRFLDGQENVWQKKEEPKVAKIEEKHGSTLQREIKKTNHTTKEKEHEMKEIMAPFEKTSGSERVEEKVHDAPNREIQREIEEVASKMVESSTIVEKTPTKKGESKDPQELTRPNMDYEISKVEEVQKENEVESRIHVLEETIYKEEGTNANEVESFKASLNNHSVEHQQHEFGTEEIKEQKKATYQEENIDSLPPHLLDEQEVLHVQEKNDKKRIHTPNIVEEESDVKKREEPMVAKKEENNNSSTLKRVGEKVVVPSTSCPQQFEVEGEEKAKKKCERGQEIENGINDDEEAKQGIEEIKDEEKDYEHVFEEQKEGEDETRGEKNNNAKISKEFFVPLVIAGSAILVTLIAIFVRDRRARKR